MARIRTIKPEFWTSAQVAECSSTARLLFIGIWNFCDDNGIHPASIKRLKMEILPADQISDEEIEAMACELVNAGLLEHYTTKNQGFWRVTGWSKHQKIEKPTYRHPLPEHGEFAASSRTSPRSVGEDSSTPRTGNGMESNGMEPNGANIISLNGLVRLSDASGLLGNPIEAITKASLMRSTLPECPHQKIIAHYHDVLPMCPRIRDWTPKRANQLRARWNEEKDRQILEYWEGLFRYIARCDFLIGKAGKRPFFANLDWITKSDNFTNIREGKYENRGVA